MSLLNFIIFLSIYSLKWTVFVIFKIKKINLQNFLCTLCIHVCVYMWTKFINCNNFPYVYLCRTCVFQRRAHAGVFNRTQTHNIKMWETSKRSNHIHNNLKMSFRPQLIEKVTLQSPNKQAQIVDIRNNSPKYKRGNKQLSMIPNSPRIN